MVLFKSLISTSYNISQAINNRIRRLNCLPSFPKVCTLAVTYRCNSKCSTCNIWKIYQTTPHLMKNELSISEIQHVFSDEDFFRKLGFVQLTGGEPFLRDDLHKIVQCIHECQPNCLIYVATNGFLTERIILATREILTFHQNFQLGISLDGVDDTHNTIRGMNNAFEKACKTLSLLRENFPNIPLQVTMTATPANFKDVPQVYDFAKKNGCFFRVALANKAEFYQNIEKQYAFSKENIEELKAYFYKIKKDLIREQGKLGSLTELFWLDGNIKFAIDQEKQILPCYSGFTQFFLDPYGNVYPCLVFSEKMGNVREKNLKEIWFSNRARMIRKQIKKNTCPNCWLAHEAFASMLNDYFRKFKYLWKS